MGNQKFSLHGFKQLTLGNAAKTETTLVLAVNLPIAFYVKKLLLFIENDASLAKAVWITWHLKDTTQYDAVIEDTKYMGLQNMTAISPVNGLDSFSYFRPIAMNYSPQFFYHTSTDGGAAMVESYANVKVSAGNDLEIELSFDTIDDGVQVGNETVDIRVSMECVVA